jgi:hypothetical protein
MTQMTQIRSRFLSGSTPALAVATLAALLFTVSPPDAAADPCGNGYLDPGETCASCAADCAVHPCAASAKPATFDVQFEPPAELTVSSITVRLGYDSRRISLPGSAGADSVRKRLAHVATNAIVATNDLDYALRVVYSRPGGIPSGRLFSVQVDGCKDAAAPVLADFTCSVEGCAAATGKVDNCSCRVTAHTP